MKKNEKKILFLVSVGGYSGAENITLIICDGLIKKGYEIAYCSPNGPIRDIIKKNKYNINYLQLKSFNYTNIKRTIKLYNPDIVYAVDFKSSVYASIMGKKYVCHLHNNPNWLKTMNFNSIVLMYAMRNSIVNICVSDSVQNEYIFSNKIKANTKIINNVVDCDKIKKLSEENVNKSYDIGIVGRICEQKDPIRFLNIINQYNKKYHNIKAVMIGADGGLLEKCKKLIELYDIDVDIVGFQSNPYKYINACKIILMPSKWEGFGLTAVESMSIGKPVLGSPVGGLKDVLNNIYLLCEKDDDYCLRINTLLTNNDKYKEYSDYCTKQAEKFSNTTEYVEIIEKEMMEIG